VSRVFDALQKSEMNSSGPPPAQPEAFFETIEKCEAVRPLCVERVRVRPERRIAVYSEPRSLAAERFRFLRMGLLKLRQERNLRAVLISSPLPLDGKSTIALNLATSLAEEGKYKILLLEGDLRRPRLIEQLDLTPWSGLAECLQNGSNPMETVRRIEPLGFYLLPAGRPPNNPTELLQSERLAQAVEQLSANFDWILIDSPPTTPIADTLALKPHCDGGLLVIRAGQTPRDAMEAAIRHFGPGFVVGIILNAVDGLERTYSAYYRRSATGTSGTQSLFST
jgi:capsular exopolysaccharide synthesis family protein